MMPGVQVPKVSRCPGVQVSRCPQYHNAPECVAAASLPYLCPRPERGLPRLRPLRPAPGKLSLSCHTSCHSCHASSPRAPGEPSTSPTVSGASPTTTATLSAPASRSEIMTSLRMMMMMMMMTGGSCEQGEL